VHTLAFLDPGHFHAALLQKTAQEYLRPENRTIVLIEPKAEPKLGPGSGS